MGLPMEKEGLKFSFVKTKPTVLTYWLIYSFHAKIFVMRLTSFWLKEKNNDKRQTKKIWYILNKLLFVFVFLAFQLQTTSLVQLIWILISINSNWPLTGNQKRNILVTKYSFISLVYKFEQQKHCLWTMMSPIKKMSFSVLHLYLYFSLTDLYEVSRRKKKL